MRFAASLMSLGFAALAVPLHAATVYAPNHSIYQPVSAVVTPAQVQTTKPKLVTHSDGRVELIPGQVVYTAPQIRVEKPVHHRSNAWQTTTEHTVYRADGSSHTARTRKYHEPTNIRKSRPVHYHQPVHQPVHVPVHQPVHHAPVHKHVHVHQPAPVYTAPRPRWGAYNRGYRHGHFDGVNQGYNQGFNNGYSEGFYDGRASKRRHCRPVLGFHFSIGR